MKLKTIDEPKRITYNKQNADLNKVIANNGWEQKLLKVTENNLLVYVDG